MNGIMDRVTEFTETKTTRKYQYRRHTPDEKRRIGRTRSAGASKVASYSRRE
jgi:hypothetical protein